MDHIKVEPEDLTADNYRSVSDDELITNKRKELIRKTGMSQAFSENNLTCLLQVVISYNFLFKVFCLLLFYIFKIIKIVIKM